MPTNNQLLVQIKGDTASIDAALQRSEAKLNAFAQATKKVSDDVSKHFNSWGTKAMGWVAEGTVIKNMYSVLKNTAAQFTAFGDMMDKAAQRTGVMASELSQLKFAAEQCGGSFEALDGGLRDLSKNLAAAEEGNAAALKTLGEIGLSPAILAGESMKEKFLMVADALKSCTSETKQTQLALQLFGKSGYKLLPLLKQGKAGIEELMVEAHKLGIDIGEKDVQNAAKMTDEINRMNSAFSSLARQGIAAIAEPLTNGMELVRNFLEVCGQFINENRKLVFVLSEIAFTLGAVFAATRTWAFLVGSLPSVITAVSAELSVAAGAMQAFAIQCVLFAACHPATAVLALAFALSFLVYIGKDVYDTMTKQAVVMEKLNHERQQAADSVDQEVDGIKKKIDRLQELSKHEKLTSQEQKELELLTRQLTEAGLDLNDVYDKRTGKLSKLGDAYDKLRDAAKKHKVAMLEEAQQEIMENMRKLGRNARKIENEEVTLVGFFTGRTREQMKELDEINKQMDELGEQFRKNEKKLEEARAETSSEPDEDKKILEKRGREADLMKDSESLTTVAEDIEKSRQEHGLSDIEKKIVEVDAQIKSINEEEKKGAISDDLKKRREKLIEESKKLQKIKNKDEVLENTNRLLELEKQLSEAGMTASQKELQALQAQNQEIAERLEKEHDLDEIQQERLKKLQKQNQKKMDALLGDEVLNDMQKKMKRLTEAFEREKREYYESLTSVNPEDIAKEKAEMEAAEEKVKKFSVTATKDQLSKDEKKLQTKENALKEARTRLANAQEDGYDAAHIEKLQQAVAAAKDARDEAKKRVADAKDAFFRASEEAFNISDFNQKIEDSEQGVKSRGTFSSAQALMMSAEDSTQEKQIVLTETLVRQLSAVGYNINQIRALVEDANFGRLE